MSTVPALDARGLWFVYPDGHPALGGVDLKIMPGERVAILGPNGAGKTTLALHLNGILAPQRGSIDVHGVPVNPSTLKAIRKRVGLVFQDPDDQLFMPTVRDDVAFGPANLGASGIDLEGTVEAALDAVGMQAHGDRPPHHLSFGQKKKVCIATVLAMEPDVLVLDEPTSNLDPAGRRELIEILSRLKMTMLMVTHDLPFALEACPRSVVMNEGRIVADDRTSSILRDEELLRANRLELPFGFDPAFL